MKKFTEREELRYYEIPNETGVIAFSGDHWNRNYGNDVEYKHFHNVTEVGLCLGIGDQPGSLESNSGKTWVYKKNTVTLVPDGVVHNTRSGTLTQKDLWSYLFFDSRKIFSKYSEDSTRLEKKFREEGMNQMYVVDGGHNMSLMFLIQAIIDCAHRPADPFIKQELESLLHSLLMDFIGIVQTDKSEQNLNRVSRDAIGRAIDFMEEHYRESIHEADIAGHCGFSETYFRRIFKEVVNMTPSEYVNLLRIQKACSVISTKDVSMNDVGVQAGFNSQSSFTRRFTHLVGISPYKWKKLSCEEKNYIYHVHVAAKEGWK